MHDLKDNSNFKFISILKKRGIDKYIYIICDKLKDAIKEISIKHNIRKLPKKIFDDNNYKLIDSFEKKFYTDDYEIIFIGIGSKNKCSNETLYEVTGKLGKHMHSESNTHNIVINLVGNDLLVIKNQVISYILGYYEFTDFKTNSKIESKKHGLTYFYHKKKKFQTDIENFIYEANVQNELRSLINIPANILT